MIQEVDGKYVVTDSTTGEYLQRSRYAIYAWKSVWSKDLELLEIFMDNWDKKELLDKGLKDTWEYHKVNRAMHRHLRALKIHLGLLEPKKPKDEEKHLIIYEEYWGFGKSPMIVQQVVIKPKSFSNGIRKNSCRWTIATDEKIQLVNEYNQKLAEFKKYQDSMRVKIFEESGE